MGTCSVFVAEIIPKKLLWNVSLLYYVYANIYLFFSSTKELAEFEKMADQVNITSESKLMIDLYTVFI